MATSEAHGEAVVGELLLLDLGAWAKAVGRATSCWRKVEEEGGC